ncbi:hypothetical protein AB0D49_40670 [Streptomyces sp. NPDC048290]|uniref:hypothetical protein n=1 Tax=Streptomyces sp. NPDC048290 TaxID=3155811 RepID=UPI00342732DA
MTTDHACQEAARRAAGAISAVRAVLPAPELPAEEPEPGPDQDLPVVLRQYLGVPERPARPVALEPPPEPVLPAVPDSVGAVVLLLFLEGMRSEMTGTLSVWYASLARRLPEVLSTSSDEPWTRNWDGVTALKTGAHEVLTALMGVGSGTASSALAARMALVEDVLCGAFRRLSVPCSAAGRCARELHDATASLYGLAACAAPCHDEEAIAQGDFGRARIVR